ncbi:SMP-30/gluconolactonase/LRE family protein [Agrococcus sp. Marseille-P2731]|uniref:SMP-30/gluconolactonase/LRE family protein n=1 Tax=Agrococcus sp. Marseille-P2731 TaxID=1841862 RepID=UPI0009315CC3|nr:SMP-30/gluconolactonase/LRE family protein [Agrococcus sp. Marseille-P2731]
MRAEQITDPIAYHGEGPCWSEGWGGLRWVDMLAGDILSFGEGGRVERRHVGTVAAAVRPRLGGGAVIGVERGFALEEPDGSVRALRELWSSPTVRMNEGGCDPDGRFYCGSMAYDQTKGAASLYRLDPLGEVERVLAGVTISNGLEWSPDGSLAYYDDTETGAIAVFDYDARRGLTGRRAFATLPDDGAPDGLTVDAEGCVWVAVANGGAVLRYRPDGVLDGRVELPVTKVTACTFGGDDLDRLFITTSQEDIDVEAEPESGALFVVEPGVTGMPVRAFAG